jgi:hypothetical protein
MAILSRAEAFLALTNTDPFTRLPITTAKAAGTALAAADERGEVRKHGNYDMAYRVTRYPEGYVVVITDLGRAPRPDVAYQGHASWEVRIAAGATGPNVPPADLAERLTQLVAEGMTHTEALAVTWPAAMDDMITEEAEDAERRALADQVGHVAEVTPEPGGGYRVRCPRGCPLGTSARQDDEAGAARRVELHKMTTTPIRPSNPAAKWYAAAVIGRDVEGGTETAEVDGYFMARPRRSWLAPRDGGWRVLEWSTRTVGGPR